MGNCGSAWRPWLLSASGTGPSKAGTSRQLSPGRPDGAPHFREPLPLHRVYTSGALTEEPAHMDEGSSERGISSRASDTGRLATKKRRRRIYMGIGAGVVVLAVVGIVSASRSKTEIDPSKLATAEKGDIARSVVATGKIQPLTKVEVKSKASGIVKKLYADYGDTVREGQLLAELDKETLQAQVREARAQLLSAQAALQRTRVEAQGPDIPFLRSAVERARRLYEQGLISTNVLEDAQKEYELALNKQRAAH